MRRSLDNAVYRGNLRTIIFIVSLVSAAFMPLSKAGMAFGLAFLAAGCVFRYLTKATLIRNNVLCRDGLYGIVRHPYYLGNYTIDSSLCLLSGNPVLLYAYPFLFFWGYGPTFRREEQFLYERYPEDYSTFLLETPQVFPSSDVHFKVAGLLPHASRERVSKKELARMLSVWASAVLIILVHELLADGFQAVASCIGDPYNLALIAIALALGLGSLLLHRKPKLAQVLDDVCELMNGLRERPDGLCSDSSLQELADRIRGALDRFGRHNVEVGHCAKFFDEFVETLQKDPREKRSSESCPLIELIGQSFENAKQSQIATYSMRKTEAVERAKQFTYQISVEDGEGQDLSDSQAACLTANWKAAVLSYAFHALSRVCIVRGDASVRITVIADDPNDPSHFRIRYTTRSRRPLPSCDELRKAFFAPDKHAGGSPGPFLVRHLFRNCGNGDLDFVDAEVAQGRLALELALPKHFGSERESMVAKSRVAEAVRAPQPGLDMSKIPDHKTVAAGKGPDRER